jgi:ABC-type nitrate/sulfonate/bicarbonate transport system substrate-binding protein
MKARHTDSKGISRRRFLKTGALSISALGVAPAFIRNAGASSLKKVTHTLGWIPSGTDAWIFMAKELGYFREAGFDVKIQRGFGSANTAKAVGLGQSDFGSASYAVMVNSVAKGLDLVGIAAKLQKSPNCIAVRSEKGVKSPKDLEGLSLGSSASSATYVLFPAFAKATGIDKSKVNFVLMNPAVRAKMFAEGKTDGSLGYYVSNIALLIGRGYKLNILLYSDYGLNALDTGLMTQSARIKKEPKTVASYVDAAMKGAAFMALHPKKTAETFKKAVPEYAKAAHADRILEVQIEASNFLALSDGVKKHGFGWVDHEDMVQTVDVLTKYMGLKDRPNPKTLYTNEFAGTIKLNAEQWKKIGERLRPYNPKTST